MRLMRPILFAVYVVIISIVLLEIAVRLWGYSERYMHDPIYTRFATTKEIPYIHKPNLVHARARGSAIIDTDELGLRVERENGSASRAETEFRIAVVGDSVTFGEGVPRTKDTFVHILQDRLNTIQSSVVVRTYNFGVSAYSVKEMAATLEHRMLAVNPNLVVMAIIPEDLSLTRIPSIDAEGYFLDRRFAAVLPEGSPIRRAFRHMHLPYAIRSVVSRKMREEQHVIESVAKGEWPEAYAYVQRFKTLADAHHVDYAIVLLPVVTSSFQRLREELERDGVRYIDLSGLRNEFTIDQFKASRFDLHPSALVHQRIGEALAGAVLKSHLPACPERLCCSTSGNGDGPKRRSIS